MGGGSIFDNIRKLQVDSYQSKYYWKNNNNFKVKVLTYDYRYNFTIEANSQLEVSSAYYDELIIAVMKVE